MPQPARMLTGDRSEALLRYDDIPVLEARTYIRRVHEGGQRCERCISLNREECLQLRYQLKPGTRSVKSAKERRELEWCTACLFCNRTKTACSLVREGKERVEKAREREKQEWFEKVGRVADALDDSSEPSHSLGPRKHSSPRRDAARLKTEANFLSSHGRLSRSSRSTSSPSRFVEPEQGSSIDPIVIDDDDVCDIPEHEEITKVGPPIGVKKNKKLRKLKGEHKPENVASEETSEKDSHLASPAAPPASTNEVSTSTSTGASDSACRVVTSPVKAVPAITFSARKRTITNLSFGAGLEWPPTRTGSRLKKARLMDDVHSGEETRDSAANATASGSVPRVFAGVASPLSVPERTSILRATPIMVAETRNENTIVDHGSDASSLVGHLGIAVNDQRSAFVSSSLGGSIATSTVSMKANPSSSDPNSTPPAQGTSSSNTDPTPGAASASVSRVPAEVARSSNTPTLRLSSVPAPGVLGGPDSTRIGVVTPVEVIDARSVESSVVQETHMSSFSADHMDIDNQLPTPVSPNDNATTSPTPSHTTLQAPNQVPPSPPTLSTDPSSQAALRKQLASITERMKGHENALAVAMAEVDARREALWETRKELAEVGLRLVRAERMARNGVGAGSSA